MDRKKLLFISNMASPYQVKFCYSLQEYFEAEFWFYVMREPNRPEWWEIPLGDKCKVMDKSGSLPILGYYSLSIFSELKKFRPDIILLGGFMNWHWLIVKWAKRNGVKVVLMSEILRAGGNDGDAENTLMSRANSPLKVSVIRKLFGDADLYLGMGEKAAWQFKEEFRFPKVDSITYPVDIDDYFNHPLRDKKRGDKITLLFANRLIDRYQPLFALEVYKRLKEKYPNLYMKMNRDGPLKDECIKYIDEHKLNDVKFLDQIDSWNNMNLIYKDSDILVLPATYSNGNMTIVESGASGMGIVISDEVNHMEEEMIDGENCFISSLDIEEFSGYVERYLKDPELLLAHGKRSRRLIEKDRNCNVAKIYYETLKDHGLLD